MSSLVIYKRATFACEDLQEKVTLPNARYICSYCWKIRTIREMSELNFSDKAASANIDSTSRFPEFLAEIIEAYCT